MSWRNLWLQQWKDGGRSWTLRALDTPTFAFKAEDGVEEHLSLSTFLAGACRKLNGMAALTILFDVHMSVPEFAPLTSLGDCICNHNAESLPESIRLPLCAT